MLYTFLSFFTGMPDISMIHGDLMYWEFISSLICCICAFMSFMSAFNLWFSRYIFLLSSIRFFTLSLLSSNSSVRNFCLVSVSETFFFNFPISALFSALYLVRSYLTSFISFLICAVITTNFPPSGSFVFFLIIFVKFLSFLTHPCLGVDTD